MDSLLLGFIVFDVLFLFVVYRFMTWKLKGKLAQVEERLAARWERDDDEVQQRGSQRLGDLNEGEE